MDTKNLRRFPWRNESVNSFILNLVELLYCYVRENVAYFGFNLAPLTYRIHPPVAVIVEVKRELSRCLSHCLVELAAAQRFNQSPEPIYGVLTTGLEWQFLKLENRVVTIEQTIYPITPIESIAALLTAIIRLPAPHRMNA